MTLQIYNSLSRTKEPFEPYDKNEVKMYVCGPTVYDSAHIGHAMSYLVFDMVRRYLESRGYGVKHVQNFTDVDDKIINRAQETGEEWKVITTRYINEFLEDMDKLNIQRAHLYPYASLEISHIIEMTKGLIEEGYAYQSEGDVYFRVGKDDDYGKLSNRKLEEQQAGTRVSDDERQRKEHPLDFALWKAAKLGEEPYWKSPWGRGRPGWHIECSAMSLRYLGKQIDIHGGGRDLVFPHHENEIAQTESYTGEVPFTKYWMHNGLLQVGGEKMSKSLKNIFAIADFLKHYSADALRLFVLSTHYRRAPTYTEESFKSAERAIDRFHTALQPAHSDVKEVDQKLITFAKEMQLKFHTAMNDDFNSALALGGLFELARAINSSRDGGVGGHSFIKAQDTLRELLSVLGFNLKLKEEKKDTASAKPFINLLVELRTNLRKQKQWALADQIRDDLDKLAVKLEDTREGTVWKLE
jgi:cysteinyl-tRNA synthetase